MVSENRKLAAILFADIKGYTALMQRDEQLALSALKKFQNTLHNKINFHNGQIVNLYGDGCLAVFNSSVDAVACAKSLQLIFQSKPIVPVRMGLHSGEIVMDDGNAFGDAVNIASRIESLAESGSVLLSGTLQSQIHNQTNFNLSFLGTFDLKDVKTPITIYALKAPGIVTPKAKNLGGSFKQEKKRTVKSILLAVLIILSIFLSWFAFNHWNNKKKAYVDNNKDTISIAILHFDDSTVDDKFKYLGFGLTEELITSLIKIKAVNVFSSDQIEDAKLKSSSPKILGEILGADYVLSGSVRANNDIIRINARMLDVVNNQFIWSYNEDRPHTDILAVQVAFSNRIINGLPIEVTNIEKSKIEGIENINPEAYALYLKGNYSANYIPEEMVKNSIYLQNAIAIDPNFALPYARLAEVEWNLAHFGSNPPIPHWIKALNYVNKALSIDSLLPEAWSHKGVIQQNYEWDYEGAEKSFRKVMALTNTDYNFDLAVLLMNNGQTAAFLDEIEKFKKDGAKASPFMAKFYISAEKYDSAKVILDSFEDDLDSDWFLNWLFSSYYLFQKQFKEAIPYLERAKQLSKSNIEPMRHLCFAYAKTNQHSKADEMLQQLYFLKENQYVAPYHLATALIGMGRINEGFKELYKAFEEHDFHLRWMYQEDVFFNSEIQNDPRYRDLLNKMKLGHLPPRKPKPLIH